MLSPVTPIISQMNVNEKIQAILATVPAKPGCYLMKNASATIIYVGKAISLRNRVRSYFHADAGHDAKTRRLVREVADIEWILVGSELEALILEMNLIKKHRPKYNVRLKDDKRYPYIKVHWARAVPQGHRHTPDGRGRLALLRAVHLGLGCLSDPGRACGASFPISPATGRSPARISAPACTTTSSSAPRPASAPSIRQATAR